MPKSTMKKVLSRREKRIAGKDRLLSECLNRASRMSNRPVPCLSLFWKAWLPS